MIRKFIPWAFISIFLLSLAAPWVKVDAGSEPIGVRVFNDGKITAQSSRFDGQTVIDYGSFQWMVLNRADLADLDALGMDYDIVENPFKLTLGGQSFDPLLSKPEVTPGWDAPDEPSQRGLHLIQFQGPTMDEWLDALKAAGLSIIQYIHPFTYLVWGDAGSTKRAAEKSNVRWTGAFLPAYALQAANQNLSAEPIQFRAMIVSQADLTHTVQAIEALGGSQGSATSGVDPAFDLISFSLPGDQIQNIAALPGVFSIQPVPTEGGDRGEMSNQVNADNLDAYNRALPGYQSWLNQLGLSGVGVVIANVDSGVDENHPDLVNRMIACTGPTCGGSAIASNHGTHTAGIMAGDGSSGVRDSFGFLRGLGMAPGANLVEQIYDPTHRLENGMLILMSESYRTGAAISGNSWGPSDFPLGYDLDTRLVDIGVRDADFSTPGNQSLTYVLSIMNGYGGTSTQGTPDEAKNTFTIGSTYLQTGDGNQRININDLSYNTAHGPALDGRFIPHMVAPGCSVDSTSTTAGYALFCGTSMASPHVSGAAALFYQQYRNRYGVDPSPALVKAAFLPVAHDLAGYLDADGGIMGHPFDSKQGWGRLDAAAVLDPRMSVDYYDQETIFSATGEFWETTLSTSQPIDELRAMLVWTDAPGHGNGGPAPAWVNDLDLSIAVGGQIFYGNNFGVDGYSFVGGSPDMMNNTEGIFLQDVSQDTITITVTAAQIAGDGVPNLGDETDQDFALAIYTSQSGRIYQYIFPLFFR